MSVNVNNSRQFNQDFTKISGLHSFKFGYEYLWQNEDPARHFQPAADAGLRQSTATVAQSVRCYRGLQGNGYDHTQHRAASRWPTSCSGYVTSYSYAQQGNAAASGGR